MRLQGYISHDDLFKVPNEIFFKYHQWLNRALGQDVVTQEERVANLIRIITNSQMDKNIAALCARLKLDGKVTDELLNDCPDRVMNLYDRWLVSWSTTDSERVDKLIELLKAHPAESALPPSGMHSHH